MRKSASKVLFAATLCVAVSSLTGCATVAPYERGTLAHPSMTTDDLANGFDNHVRAVSEGATGGFGGGGGGCGCN
jgi:predicted RecA/RadA family phage recombinase